MSDKMVVGVINFGNSHRSFSFSELSSESRYCDFYHEVDKVIMQLPVGRRDKAMDDKMWHAIHRIKDLLGR